MFILEFNSEMEIIKEAGSYIALTAFTPVILLPLHLVSLTQKIIQRRKIIHSMHPVGCKG